MTTLLLNPASASVPRLTPTYEIKAPSSLLLGDVGTGKTHSLVTFLLEGIETFVLVTEPTGVDTLIDAVGMLEKSSGKSLMPLLHWHLVRPATLDIGLLIAQARNISACDVSALQKMDAALLNKGKFTQFMEMLKTIENFPCDRTGQSYGNVTTWNSDRAFALDSLSGLSYAVNTFVSGTRATMTQPEYGIAQTAIHSLLMTLCGLNCFFVLTAHLERELDEVTQAVLKMVSTTGKKLAPKVPVPFSEVICSKRGVDEFYWATDLADTTTKWRALPRGSKLPATFVPLVRAYNRRVQQAKGGEAQAQK